MPWKAGNVPAPNAQQAFCPTRPLFDPGSSTRLNRIGRQSEMVAALSAFLILLCVRLPARGALYEFTFEGKVIASQFPGVAVDDTSLFRFHVESAPLIAVPNEYSHYAATAPVMEFPHLTLNLTWYAPLALLVRANAVSGRDEFSYGAIGFNDAAWVQIEFPLGSLTPTELPVAMPISDAVTARMGLSWSFNPVIDCRVDSVMTRVVPEPSLRSAVILVPCLLKRLRSHRAGKEHLHNPSFRKVRY